MKTPSHGITRYSKWQYLVLVATIIILALSALPNFYGETATVSIRSDIRNIHNLDSNTLYQQLKDHQFDIKKIYTDNDRITILLGSTEQQEPLQQYLKHQLNDDYQVAMSMLSASPSWLSELGMSPIKLGLDLRGGVQFLLDVDTQVAVTEHLKQIKNETKKMFRQAKIYGVKVSLSTTDKIIVTYPQSSDDAVSSIKSELKRNYPNLQLTNNGAGKFSLLFDQNARDLYEREIIKQNLHTMRGRIEELGITEAATTRQGKNRIRIELPGVQDPQEARRIIGATASLDFHQLKEFGGKTYKTKEGKAVQLDANPIMAGKHIKDARAGVDEMGMPMVNLVLDNSGGKMMKRHSQKHLGDTMVTVFSEYSKNAQGKSTKKSNIINMATIQVVLGSRFSITNMESSQKATELALLLRAGSLTAPVTIVAQSAIGPSLGQDNINNGMAALMLGLGIILAFMALWYRRLGIVANTVLLINLVCLLGLISLLPGAVLTLPGIAGLVLTIGMAVDTNVLIFERIKQESKKGRSPRMAVEYGYNNAFTTILDANITTMITAMILYSVGDGPVKGFAITLGLGLLTSMFTGVFASRAIVNLLLTKNSRLLKGVTQ
jgi:preprotein translocase subunit SecD